MARNNRQREVSSTADAIDGLTAMWAAIAAARLEHCGEVIARPAECVTVREFARKFDLTESGALKMLGVLVKKGAMKMQRAYVPNAAGRNQAVNVYMVAQ